MFGHGALIFFSDRTGGGKFCEEYELATTKLEEFSEMLRREQQERLDMIKVLEDGEAFYDTSYGEVKVIVHVSIILLTVHQGWCINILTHGLHCLVDYAEFGLLFSFVMFSSPPPPHSLPFINLVSFLYSFH